MTATAERTRTTNAAPETRATIARSVLFDALARASLALSRENKGLPVLHCVRIAAADGGLRFSATDLDRAVSVTVPAEAAAEFPARVVPCQRLAAIVAQLPDEPVAVVARGNGIRLTAGRARFDLSGFPADEFPTGERDERGALTSLSMDAPVFVSALARCAGFASHQPSRPTLNGIHVRGATNARLEIEATDGYQLAREWVERPSGPAIDIIIPGLSIPVITKLFADAERLTVEVQGLQAVLASDDGTRLTTRLIEGPFNDTGPLWRKMANHDAVIDRVALLGAVKRAAAVSTNERFIVRLEWNADHVVVAGIGDEDVGASEETVACTLSSGAPLCIAFNPRYLVQALSARTAETVRIGIEHPERAMTLRDDGIDVNQNLIMPRREIATREK